MEHGENNSKTKKKSKSLTFLPKKSFETYLTFLAFRKPNCQ